MNILGNFQNQNGRREYSKNEKFGCRHLWIIPNAQLFQVAVEISAVLKIICSWNPFSVVIAIKMTFLVLIKKNLQILTYSLSTKVHFMYELLFLE